MCDDPGWGWTRCREGGASHDRLSRHLHWKLDQLLTHQWRRLLEILQIQTELIEELARRRREEPP